MATTRWATDDMDLAAGQRVSYVGIFGHKVAGVVVGTTRDPWGEQESVLVRVTATRARAGVLPR